MKDKKILHIKDNKFSEKLEEVGISKENSKELFFHFYEIEAFYLGFRTGIKNILKTKNKKKIKEELENIWDDLKNHIIKNHFIPARNLLDKNEDKF